MTAFTSVFDEAGGGVFYRFDGDDFVIFMPHVLKKKTIRMTDSDGRVYNMQRMHHFFLHSPERWNDEWTKPIGTSMFLCQLNVTPMQHASNPAFFEFGFFLGAMSQRMVSNKDIRVETANEDVSPEDMQAALAAPMQLREPDKDED